jgi:hypothetical protein
MINENEKSALCSQVGAKRKKFRKLEVKQDEIGRECRPHGEKRYSYRSLLGNQKEKDQ